ncbi:MAG: GNAT family N-acetyltransferase [Tepidiformaceae bacterium]
MSEEGRNAAWQGEKLRLRAVEVADWETFHSFDADTEAARHGWRVALPRSRGRTREWAREKSAQQPRPDEDDNWFWAIEDGEGAVVGSMSTHTCDRMNGVFEYGISIAREHWGKGYAEEAILLVLRYFFGELRYNKANAWVYDFNERSQRMHEKAGFQREGRVRGVHYTAGRHHDAFVYGMTAAEFFARQREPQC